MGNTRMAINRSNKHSTADGRNKHRNRHLLIPWQEDLIPILVYTNWYRKIAQKLTSVNNYGQLYFRNRQDLLSLSPIDLES